MLFDVQVEPELVEVKIKLFAATNFVPSAEDATVHQPIRGSTPIQVAPEFVETKIPLFPGLGVDATATNLLPSDEDATPCQILEPNEFEVQFTPALVEVKIGPS
jgi:hypothetical protein